MLRGATWRAAAIVGTAVFRIVASSSSMKKATATSQGKSRLIVVVGAGADMAWSSFVTQQYFPIVVVHQRRQTTQSWNGSRRAPRSFSRRVKGCHFVVQDAGRRLKLPVRA